MQSIGLCLKASTHPLLAGEYFHTKCKYHAAVRRSVYSFLKWGLLLKAAKHIDQSPLVSPTTQDWSILGEARVLSQTKENHNNVDFKL